MVQCRESADTCNKKTYRQVWWSSLFNGWGWAKQKKHNNMLFNKCVCVLHPWNNILKLPKSERYWVDKGWLINVVSQTEILFLLAMPIAPHALMGHTILLDKFCSIGVIMVQKNSSQTFQAWSSQIKDCKCFHLFCIFWIKLNRLLWPCPHLKKGN